MNDSAKKVLIVDDDPANLALINGILSSFCKAYPIISGEEALEFLDIQHPDLILLDEEMPGMTGIEFFRELKKNAEWRDIPVIFLTGLNDIKAESDAFKLGAADFIRKPVDDAILLHRVKMHLEYDLLRKFKQALLSLES